MTSTFQFWDETNSAILFDCYDSTGANASDNGYSATFLAGNPDFGTPGYEFERFSPPQSDGGSTTFKRMGLRTMTVPLMIRASTYDNYATAVGRLAQLCYNGGVIKWIPDGSARTLYIDFEPSPAPFFLDGRPTALVEAVRLFGTGTGITLTLTVQPTFRGAELDSAGNLFTNATLLRDADGAGRPDGWTWSSTSNISNENIDATAEAFEFDMAVSGANRSLTQSTSAASAAVGQDWTVSGYVRVSSSTMTNARAQAMLTWRTSAPADISTITSTLTALTSAWQRFSISGTAPATTDRIQAGMRFNNTSATSATIQMKNLQVEMTTAAQPFRVGNEAGVHDPAPTSGMGRIFPLYNPGDAPVPVSLVFGSTQINFGAALVTSLPRKGTLATWLNGASISQFETWTPGTDTAVDTNASSSLGSSPNTGLLTTFVTTTLQQRATVTISTAATLAAYRNRSFRVMMRFAGRTASYTGVITLDLKTPGAGTQTVSTTITAAASGSYYEVELGTITMPDTLADDVSFTAYASRTSGTGNLVWDYLELIPLEQLAFVTASGVGASQPLHSYPEQSRWAYTNTTDEEVRSTVAISSKGPVLAIAPPGLSMVEMLPLSTDQTGGITSTTGYSSGTLTTATSMRFVFSPRYLT